MTRRPYRAVFTDHARRQLLELDGAERLAHLPAGSLDGPAVAALLAGTALGELLTALDDLGADPFGGLTLARTAGAEDDRVALLAGSLAVTYMVSAHTDPPAITVTSIRGPKGR
ncbi:hypothetical protein ACIG5E_34265 [Kitasatospora sp. NPDC053057]|uniref:hypothetical protein n=1 Tax=Kitasatospora sp. NPDC053057 TaxID=3364062 RepID=UPI0037C9C4AC